VLLHLVEAAHDDVASAYRTVREELEAYGHSLAEKPEVVALSKADLFSPDALSEKGAQLKSAMRAAGVKSAGPLVVSAATGQAVEQVLRALLEAIDREASQRTPAPAPAWQP
jgi:GTPase